MAQTERAQAEKRQTPFVLQPALRRTACAAAACLALIAGYQYFADGGKETVSGVKVALGRVADISTNRYVAKNAVAPAATVYAQTQNSPAVLQPNGRVEQTADAIAQPTQNGESAQISTPQHLNPSTSQHPNPSTSQPHNPSTPLLAYTPADNSRGRHEGAAARWTLSTSAMTGMGASSVTNSTATYVEAVGPDDVIWADNPQLGIGIYNQGKSV